MTQEDKIKQLEERCAGLESIIIDLLDTLIENKGSVDEFARNVGTDAEDLKEIFETSIEDY